LSPRLVPSLLALLVLAAGCASPVRRPPEPVPPPAGADAPVEGAPRTGQVTAGDGVPIAYTVAGTGSPTLLFVHGWGGDRGMWEAAMRALSPIHRVVALDLPGHGASGAGRADWTVPVFGDDVARVLAALDLREVVLVGHSMGGSIALDAAAREPARVLAVVGVDTLHDVERKEEGDDALRVAMEAMQQDFVPACRTFVGSIFGAAAAPALVASVQAKVCGARPETALAILRGLTTWDDAAALRRVKVPVRCIQGDRFPTNLEGNRRHHADFDVIVLPGTGHFPQLEAEEDFLRALRELLGSLRQAGRATTKSA
jgi:pimeloyl-ACP methyl ester carboxylesterase